MEGTLNITEDGDQSNATFTVGEFLGKRRLVKYRRIATSSLSIHCRLEQIFCIIKLWYWKPDDSSLY